MKKSNHPVIQRVLTERFQGQETRRELFTKLESLLGRSVLALFTSFRFPVMLEAADVDMVEGVLQKMDLSKGLALLISSPGGSGLAAERLIRICRSYSGTGEYWAIVPSKAKSAATLACFGASKIVMSPTSELGPVDPQLAYASDGGVGVRWSAHNVIQSYKDLFKGAVKAKGNLEPYLLQLGRYDSRDIAEFETEVALSKDISRRALQTGMMRRKTPRAIMKSIDVFLTPTVTKSHGRAIYADEAKKCGLNIEIAEVSKALWTACYELYIRTDQFCSTTVSKCVETREHSFNAAAPGGHDEN
jgi:hypothetical protein